MLNYRKLQPPPLVPLILYFSVDALVNCIKFSDKIFLPFFSVYVTLYFHLFYDRTFHVGHAVAGQVKMGAGRLKTCVSV